MKEIDRRGRTLNRVVFWGLWLLVHGLFLLVFLQNKGEHTPIWALVLYGLMSAYFSFSAVYFGHYTAPRAYFSEDGVYIKYFIRKKFYPWGNIQEALVLEMKARTRYSIETYYRFFLLTSEGTQWRPGDTEKTYRRRNRGKLLQIPLTKESREYVKKYHGKLFFDESHGKKILWRMVK